MFCLGATHACSQGLRLPHYDEVKELIKRVGGDEAYSQFLQLLSGGWGSPMAMDMVEQCASMSKDALAAATSGVEK